MGLARIRGHKANLTDRLGFLAEELKPRRRPWFVSQPSRPTPSQGWWWIPQGHKHAILLGHNHIVAETELRVLLDALERPA